MEWAEKARSKPTPQENFRYSPIVVETRLNPCLYIVLNRPLVEFKDVYLLKSSTFVQAK